MAKISANKLAELLITASASRRHRIIRDQKYPNDAIVTLYRHAYAPIEEYFQRGRDVTVIRDAAERLREDREGSEWTIDDRWNTAEALERFAEIADGLPSDSDERYFRGDRQPPKLNISGVDISVRPDFLIEFNRRGQKYTGALKLHFVKNQASALTRTGSEYVSTLLYQWLEAHGPDGSVPSYQHCISIDVFRGTTFQAPRSNVRRMQEISILCEDIAYNWPRI